IDEGVIREVRIPDVVGEHAPDTIGHRLRWDLLGFLKHGRSPGRMANVPRPALVAFLCGESDSPSVPAPVILHAVVAGQDAPDAFWQGLPHRPPGVLLVPRPARLDFLLGESDT